MESNESSNMAAASNSSIDIVQSLMQDQGYLQEAFESSYESMDFLNQPDAASSTGAKDEASKTYAPEEFLNEPGVSQVTNKNNDSTQSEFERLLNEDIVDDTEEIVVGLSNEAVTFLDKATEEFGIVSKPISDKDIDKTLEKMESDTSNELKLGLGDASDDKTLEKIDSDKSNELKLGLGDASDDKTLEKNNSNTSNELKLASGDAYDDKTLEKVDSDTSNELKLGLGDASDDKTLEKIISNTSNELKLASDDAYDDKTFEKVDSDTSNELKLGLGDALNDKTLEKINSNTSNKLNLVSGDASDDKSLEKVDSDISNELKLDDIRVEKISQDVSKGLSVGLGDASDDKKVEKVSQDASKGLGFGLDNGDDKIDEKINQVSSKDLSLGLEDASNFEKKGEKINEDASNDLSMGLPANSDENVEFVVNVAVSSTLESVPKLTNDSAQVIKENSANDVQSKEVGKESSDNIIQVENIVSHLSVEETQVEETKDICSSSNSAEIVTTESLEAMLESLDGPAAPDLIESEGSTNSITVSNTFIRESLQELMEETPTASEQDDWLVTPLDKRVVPVDSVTDAADTVSNTTLDDNHACLDIEIKEEIESENEISFTETFCERSCLIDQDTDRHNFKMFECKVLSIELHDIIKTESARDAKAGLYKPSERKSIDIIRKEYKTKEMQDYIRRAKRMKLPVEKASRRSSLSQFSSPARKMINKTSNTLHKTPVTAKSTVGHKTPAQSAKKPLAQSSIKTPTRSSIKTPARSSVKTPARSSVKTPARSSVKTPARSSVKTPAQGSIKTPARSSIKTPARSSNKNPAQITVKTPSVRSTIKSSSRNSVKFPSAQNSVKTPSARRAVKTPSRFSDETLSQSSNKTPARSSIKTPSVQSATKTLPTRSSLRTPSQTSGKTSAESKTVVNVSQNTRKRMHNEIQTPKRMRFKQEEKLSPQPAKKIRLSPDAKKNLKQKKIPVSSKKKNIKENVSFETATKLLTIDLQDIMKMSNYSNSKLMKGTKVDFSKSKSRNIKRAGTYRKPIRSIESKRTNIKKPLKAKTKTKSPAKFKSPPKSKVEVKSKSVPKNNSPEVPILESRRTRNLTTRRNPPTKIYNKGQSVKRLRPKRDSEGKFKKRKQDDYVDDMFDDNDDYDEDYQPSRTEANYTCFDCMEDFETNAELKVHKRLEHNKSTTTTPRKTPIKAVPKKKKGTVPVYFKSDQYRIDRTVGKKSMKEFRPAIDTLNKDDMIQGANMVNHHISFYNQELGKNITDQEMYQHMMKKYTIKSAQLCIGSNRFRSYYQLANSPDDSIQTKISTVKEERGHVLITSPLLHW